MLQMEMASIPKPFNFEIAPHIARTVFPTKVGYQRISLSCGGKAIITVLSQKQEWGETSSQQ